MSEHKVRRRALHQFRKTFSDNWYTEAEAFLKGWDAAREAEDSGSIRTPLKEAK